MLGFLPQNHPESATNTTECYHSDSQAPYVLDAGKISPVKLSLPEKDHYHPHGNAPEDAGSLPRLKENACGIRRPTSSAAIWVDTSPEAEAYRASSVGPEQLRALPYCACAYVLGSERAPSAAHKGWVLPPSAGHWEECRVLRTPFTRIDSLEWWELMHA